MSQSVTATPGDPAPAPAINILAVTGLPGARRQSAGRDFTCTINTGMKCHSTLHQAVARRWQWWANWGGRCAC
jgi:hypothetical protein